MIVILHSSGVYSSLNRVVPGPKILQNQPKISYFTKDLSKIEWFPGTSGTTSNDATELSVEEYNNI